jgi:hypothetical protein
MRKLPPVYPIAFATWLVSLVVTFVQSFQGFEQRSDRMGLVGIGAHFAGNALLVAGAFELSRRVAGRARQALRVAGWVSLAFILAAMVMRWTAAFLRGEHSLSTFYEVWGNIAAALEVATVIALAVAAWSQRSLAIGGLAVCVVAIAANRIAGPLSNWLDWGRGGFYRVYALASLVDLAGTSALVLGAARTAAAVSPEPPRATRGLSRVAGALYMRVVAMCVGTGLTVLFVVGMSHRGDSVESFLKLGVFSGAAVALLSQAWLSIGVIDAASAAVGELAPWSLGIAAALALWCTGVMNFQLPEMYATLYGKYGSFGGDMAQALATALPLVATVSLAIVAATIGAFATRRSLEELRVHASGKGIGFVVLTLVGIAITGWGIPKAESLSSFVVMSLGAIGAMLAASLLMARLCKLAASAVDSEPGLPTAKIVS